MNREYNFKEVFDIITPLIDNYPQQTGISFAWYFAVLILVAIKKDPPLLY